ncbi:hypothetical protein BDN70DRAFT_929914 [Pholiota conissans]|uniref:Uncharacterized protein n=1 Tax=Pholiota conissans TaxID=109636 RepID=A0A9P6D3X7_9AGAR|nr:hypothetical protein BDN70DRAFT_929914 [Pholiota conissans]
MPDKVIYKFTDLVLLSIVTNDRREPPCSFDWAGLPFPRPRIHHASTANFVELSKLNFENEEGIVVKFWRSPHDQYHQRVKVKFESYLQAISDSVVKSMSKISIPSASGPPSNQLILELYFSHRARIHHFKANLISERMSVLLKNYLRSLEPIADDYGGEDWIQHIECVWNRIDALVDLQEAKWIAVTGALIREGYKPNTKGQCKLVTQGFLKRIRRTDIDIAYRSTLLSWFNAEPAMKQVELCLKKYGNPCRLEILPSYTSASTFVCNIAPNKSSEEKSLSPPGLDANSSNFLKGPKQGTSSSSDDVERAIERNNRLL